MLRKFQQSESLLPQTTKLTVIMSAFIYKYIWEDRCSGGEN